MDQNPLPLPYHAKLDGCCPLASSVRQRNNASEQKRVIFCSRYFIPGPPTCHTDQEGCPPVPGVAEEVGEGARVGGELLAPPPVRARLASCRRRAYAALHADAVQRLPASGLPLAPAQTTHAALISALWLGRRAAGSEGASRC